MTRTYAAKRLFEHGPLSYRQFIEVTGWSEDQARGTLRNLLETGIVRRAPGARRYVYELVS